MNNNWNLPWGTPWQGFPHNVFDPTIFPGHSNGYGQYDFAFRNNFPFQPPFINPVVNRTQSQNLPQPTVSVNQPIPQRAAVRTDNGGTEQPSTSNADTPRQVDNAPTGILVCSDIYLKFIYHCVSKALGEKMLCLSPAMPVFYFDLHPRRLSFWSCVRLKSCLVPQGLYIYIFLIKLPGTSSSWRSGN